MLMMRTEISITYYSNGKSLFELVGKRVSLNFETDGDANTFRGFNITYITFLGQFRVKY